MKVQQNFQEVRIKRANTDWWINEKCIVGNNGLTYIAYFNDLGEIHLKEFDAQNRYAVNRDVTLCRMNCWYSDEHNSPSLCVTEEGYIIVIYTGHGATHSLTCRVTEKPYDITSFGKPIVLDYSASVTYAQLFENTKRKELWLFTRVAGVTWEFRTSADCGKTWSEAVKFLASDAGGLFYFDVRKQIVANHGLTERWFFALYGHPRVSKDHTIRSGFFNDEGTLCRMDGTETEVNLFGQKAETRITIENLEAVYASPEGTTCRLLDVSPTVPCRVGYCTFTLDCPESITYYGATWTEDGWKSSAPICKGGEFLSTAVQRDGSQTYVGGMAYYYGVGNAGLHKSGGLSLTDRLYIARYTGSERVIESYLTKNGGDTYELEEVIKAIPNDPTLSPDENIKIWRPIVPIYAQDNLPVYWHEGTYSAHTGGWHCDAVMFVQYENASL